jgi:hypothetical protein
MPWMRPLAALPVLALLAACAPTAPLRAPIEDFERGVAATARAIAVYYNELNALERDLYLDERVRDPSLEIAYRSGAELTPLAGATFSPESIAARLDALDLLRLYGVRLAALAGTEAPETLAGGLTALGARADAVRETFLRLQESDGSAAKYGGPLGTLAATFAQSALEGARDALLRRAIGDATPAVNTLIDLMEADLATIVRPLRLTATKVTIANLVSDYNARRQKMSESQRRSAANRIRDAQERYEATLLFKPAGLMQDLRDAHGALVSYARSGGDDRPAAVRLTAALEVFRERAEEARDAVERLRRAGGDR